MSNPFCMKQPSAGPSSPDVSHESCVGRKGPRFNLPVALSSPGGCLLPLPEVLLPDCQLVTHQALLKLLSTLWLYMAGGKH